MLKQSKILNDTYRIVSQVGTGGGGDVYLAEHIRLKKDVVLKRIKDDVKGILNVRGEADILKNLKHANLPGVTDFFIYGDDVFTAMDYVPGDSFENIMKESRVFDQKDVIHWAGQLCDALAYLHSRKPPVIHSDIKPGNVMLTPDGDVFLIDFNISLILTQDASAMGYSKYFSPPEQRPGGPASAPSPDATEMVSGEETALMEEPSPASQRHRALKVDVRSDIYSLGATLYYLLTGALPGHDAPPLAAYTQLGLSDGLCQVVGKAMQPDPQQRYQTAAEMMRDLKNIHKIDRRYRRHIAACRGTAIGYAAAFVVLCLVTYWGWLTMGQEKTGQYRGLLDAGLAAEQQENYTEASRYYLEAAALLPNHVDGYTHLASMMYRNGEYEECIAFINGQVITRGFGDDADTAGALANINYILGSCCYELGDYGAAARNLGNAMRYDPENVDYRRDYAVTLARGGDWQGADAILEQYRSSGVSDGSVALIAGEIAYAQGDFAEAIDNFDRVIQSASDVKLRSRAYIMVAESLNMQGAYDEEIKLLQEGIAALPAGQGLLLSERLAGAYMQKGRSGGDADSYRKAQALYEEMLGQGNISLGTQLNLALTCQYLEEYDKGLEILEKLAGNYPENYRVYMRLAFMEASRQQSLPLSQRDYSRVGAWYEQAAAYYTRSTGGEGDAEMLVLENLMGEFRANGWIR